MSIYDKLKFDANGLIPAIIQEQKTGRVLMMAWMNRASLEKTIGTGKTHFWSRSRQRFWMKGESSGHTQAVREIAFDCDGQTHRFGKLLEEDEAKEIVKHLRSRIGPFSSGSSN